MENKIRVLLIGLGPMGKRIAKVVLQKKGLTVIGALDLAEEIIGKDLGEVLELGKRIGVIVSDDAKELLARIKADIAIIATTSKLKDVYPQIVQCATSGINIISTCEELTYPYHKHPQLSNEIDILAKSNNITVLGTGINPGFLMDTLPIILTCACERVESIKVVRMMDSSKRRIPYQKKIGTGLSENEFRRMIDEGRITGHVGLIESIAMIANALGWKLDSLKEFPPEPVIARKEIKTSCPTVGLGQVAGLKSVAQGAINGKPVIILDFISHAAVEEEYDEISIEGVPKIYEKITGGVNGDIGTVAVVINMIPIVLNAKPGLVTMKDLPLPSCVTEDVRTYLTMKKSYRFP